MSQAFTQTHRSPLVFILVALHRHVQEVFLDKEIAQNYAQVSFAQFARQASITPKAVAGNVSEECKGSLFSMRHWKSRGKPSKGADARIGHAIAL